MSVLGFNTAFEKQPSEQITVKASFNDVADSLVVAGYGLNNCTVTVYDFAGADKSNNMISGNATVDSNNSAVLVTIKAGSDGQNYYAKFLSTWSMNGEPEQIIERDLQIQVREKGK